MEYPSGPLAVDLTRKNALRTTVSETVENLNLGQTNSY
jgi:hypothetical protein